MSTIRDVIDIYKTGVYTSIPAISGLNVIDIY